MFGVWTRLGCGGEWNVTLMFHRTEIRLKFNAIPRGKLYRELEFIVLFKTVFITDYMICITVFWNFPCTES